MNANQQRNQQRNQQITRIVRAIQAVIDKSWIPEEFRGLTFFGLYEHWIYNTSEGDNVCEECRSYNAEDFNGSEIRGVFPYLEIRDENLIYPRVHPNCNCQLIRLLNVEA